MRSWSKDPVRETMREVYAAMLLLFLAEELVVLLAVEDGIRGSCLLGILAGNLIAAGYFWHIRWSLDRSLAYQEKTAARGSALRLVLVRYVAAAALMIAAALSGAVNMLALLVGLITLKPALYLQPIVHRLYHKGEEEKPAEALPEEEEGEEEEYDEVEQWFMNRYGGK